MLRVTFHMVCLAMGVFFASISHAQAEVGVYDLCADRDLLQRSASELLDDGWTKTNDPSVRSATFASALFLGNVDGVSGTTWQSTLDWATQLAGASQPSGDLYERDSAFLLVGRNSADQPTCLFVSKHSDLAMFESLFPDAAIMYDGPRTFFHMDDDQISVSASVFPETARPGFELHAGVQFTVAYRHKSKALRKGD